MSWCNELNGVNKSYAGMFFIYIFLNYYYNCLFNSYLFYFRQFENREWTLDLLEMAHGVCGSVY